MPDQTPDLTFQEKTFAVTCVALVATYVGFAINSRRLLKKSLQESTEIYEETSKEIQDAVARVKQ
jgi:hypothetical protein